MNIAIVGSSGYISGFLIKKFERCKNINKVIKIDQNDSADLMLNLLEPEKFEYSVLNDIDFIIFTAAISGPDKCAQEFDFCEKINVIGTKYFIREAISRGCKVIFFSSDAVFGNGNGVFNEDSVTAACTPYGMMKKAVEDEFKHSSYFKAIRLSYVISDRDKFVSYCLKCIDNKEIAEIYHPFYRNCTTIGDVMSVVDWLLKNWIGLDSPFLNVAGNELVSRVRIADELNRLFDDKLNYKVIFPTSDFFKNRPQITQMNSKYLYRLQILENESFTEKLRKEFK